MGQEPAHHVATEDVEQDVEVVPGPGRGAAELGDIPAPELVGRRGEELGRGVPRMSPYTGGVLLATIRNISGVTPSATRPPPVPVLTSQAGIGGCDASNADAAAFTRSASSGNALASIFSSTPFVARRMLTTTLPAAPVVSTIVFPEFAVTVAAWRVPTVASRHRQWVKARRGFIGSSPGGGTKM